MKLFQNPILLFCICLFASCKQEYNPKIKSSEQSLLVVEGVLNTAGPTSIRLTRSFKLDDSAQLQTESGAQVTVESKAGAAFPLYEQTGGTYNADQLPLDSSEKYRLHIITNNGKEYASDYVPVLTNPPIDSVFWRQDANGVNIYLNTHDPQNNTRYYRWQYEETWEIHAGYESQYKLVNDQPVARGPGEEVYICWRHFNPSELLLYSTTQLSQDVVSERQLVHIPNGSDKLSVRYSVLVRQFTLSKEGYAFYELMKKNTESLGSIFDAQPSEISGNVHALSDSSAQVIGFITAAPVHETRIFILRENLDWHFIQDCSYSIKVSNNPDSIAKYFGAGTYWPYAADKQGPVLLGYYASHPECTDCTLLGGSTERPSFW